MKQFKQDVLKGLSASPKHLPSKYFYNEIGDALFVKIMQMPEYYLTRSEQEILKMKASEIVHSFQLNHNRHFELIELGAGDGTKTIEILKELIQQNYDFSYLPIDISENALDGIHSMLKRELPELEVNIKQGDYFGILASLKESNCPKVVFFLGSNLGNMSDEKATEFMTKLSATLAPNDRVLLGVDLIKAKEIVLPAYDDPQGITRDFNLNLLRRINDELGGDFKLNQFEHVASYQEREGIAKSFLKSKMNQVVTVSSINQSFLFEKDEVIHTEISRKYNDEVLANILSESKLEVQTKFMDSANLFADYVLIRK